jgi:SET domain-containing protein
MPKLDGLSVVASGIHGYGVIATRDFAVGEVVAGVDGVLWNGDEEDRDDRYSLWLGDSWMFDMVDQTRWINHSCEPNCEIEGDVEPDGTGWARIVATRAIRAGEEITYDYGFDAEVAEPCTCGAGQCRGWIVEADQLARLNEIDLRRRTS